MQESRRAARLTTRTVVPSVVLCSSNQVCTMAASDSTGPLSVPQGKAFPSTHWSVVLAARDPSSTVARQALEKLCQVYWYPLYGFVRGRGRTPEDAQDLTQAFFARFLERESFRQA